LFGGFVTGHVSGARSDATVADSKGFVIEDWLQLPAQMENPTKHSFLKEVIKSPCGLNEAKRKPCSECSTA